MEVGGSTSPDCDREARVEDPKPPVFEGVRDTQDLEKVLWHLKNYFKCSRVRSDENKINTVMLYLFEMAMLWWRCKEAEIRKEGHSHLLVMQIVKGLKKGELMFLATIASSGEDNGTMDSLPP